MLLLLVGIAGGLGALARHGLSTLGDGPATEWITLGVNVSGSFLLGVLLGGQLFSSDTRTVLGAGFLGGFTTFSTFSAQAVSDVESGAPLRALAYVGASVGLGLLAAAVGMLLGRALAPG